MSPLPWSLHLLDLAAGASAAALELLLQSTLVIALGLTAAWLFRGRGSALRSAIFRATLVAVVACPAAASLISALGLSAAIDWLPSLRPTVVKLEQPASDPSEIGRGGATVQNGAFSDTTAQLSGAPARPDDPFPSSRVGEPFGNSPQFSDVPFDEARGVRRESSGDRRAEPLGQDGIVAVKAVPARPAGPAWVVNPAAAALAIGIAAFWLLGSSALFLRLLIDHFRVLEICRTASSADAGDRLLRDELAAKLGVSAPRLLRSPYLSGPCLTGLWRHTILLPEESSDVPLSSVLIHELAHLRRGDSGWNLLRHAVRVVLFFQPLLWCLSRRMEEAAEEVCDDHVVHWGADRSVYADGLVRLAEQRSLPLSTVVPLVRFRSLLGRRVQRILDRSHRLSLRAGMKALCAIAAAGLAVTLVVALVAPSSRTTAAPPSEAKKSDEGADKKSADAAKAAETPNDAKRVSGTVLLPSGKPAAGAHVVLIGQPRQARRPADVTSADPIVIDRTQSDGAGYFQLTPANLSSSRYLWARLLVRSGHTGLAWRVVNLENADSSFSISLPEAVTARGRLITLEGKPAAGIRITVQGVTRSGITDSSGENGVYRVGSPPPADVWPSGIVTDADGWYTVPGVAADAELGLCADQEPFAPEQWWLDVDKPVPSQRVHALTPAQIIKGVMVAADTGKPLANASIDACQGREFGMHGMMSVSGKTDAEGRFRVNPYAAKSHTVTAFGPEGSAYLAKEIEFTWSDTEREHDIRVELPRGVRVHGAIAEKVSGKPVAKATVRYTARRNNPHATGVPLLGVDQPTELTDEQGRFSIAVPAGAGHLTVKSATVEYVLKDLDERPIREGRPGGQRLYVNADAAIDLPADAREYEIDFKIRRGVTVHGEMVRSDGRPPDRLVMLHRGMTLISDEFQIDSPTMLAGNRFEIRCVPPDGEYQEFFLDPDAKQCKLFVAHGSDAGKPLRVGLEQCGSLTMRFLDPDGKPVAGHSPRLSIVFTSGKPQYDFSNKSDMPQADETLVRYFDRVNCLDMATDESGRITIPTLIPGLMYRLLEISDKGQEDKPWKYREITVKPGERLTLPDIVIRNPDVLQRAEVNWTKKQKEQATKAATPSVANSGESPTQMPTGTTSAVQAPTVERAMSNAAANAADTPFHYRGRVVDPNGKPVAGAKLFLVYWTHGTTAGETAKPRAVSDAQGSFEFIVKRSEFEADGNEGLSSQLFAVGTGFGFAAASSVDFETSGELLKQLPLATRLYLAARAAGHSPVLHLVPDDVPITGRVLTIEGHPVAGARVRVKELSFNDQGSLDSWERAAKEPKADYYSLRNHAPDTLNGPQLAAAIPDAVADADGRFTLAGVGRERIVQMLISGPGIETREVTARTRQGEKVVVPQEWSSEKEMKREGVEFEAVYYGASFVHVAGPSKPVEGRVTDADTGKPLAGIRVSAGMNWTFVRMGKPYIAATTDADGKYRLEGLPIGKDETIYVVPPGDTAYLPAGESVTVQLDGADKPHDFRLKLGIWVRGKVVDDRTGEPVPGAVRFFTYQDNSHLKAYPGFSGAWGYERRADRAGRFQIAVIPGPGVIAFMADEHSRFRRGLGAETLTGRFTGGGKDLMDRMFRTRPGILSPGDEELVRQIAPEPDSKPLDLTLALTSGIDVVGRLLDPDGKPLSGGIASGEVFEGSWYPIQGETFRVEGYYPDRPRELFFFHQERNLAGHYVLKGQPPKDLSIRLEPAGAIRGRLLDVHGAPLSGIRLRGSGVPDDNSGDARLRLSTDDAGRFEIRGLIPGRKYTVDGDGDGTSGRVLVDRTAEAGKTEDVGDVTMQSPDPTKTLQSPPAPTTTESDPKDAIKSKADTAAESASASGNKSTQSDRKAADDLLSVNGRVLDPQGKPVAGTKIAAVDQVWKTWTSTVTLAATKSDQSGHFHLEFRKPQHPDRSPDAWRWTTIVAYHEDRDYSVNWTTCGSIKTGEDVTFQLVPDEPIEGRVIDLEGRPVSGVNVALTSLTMNATNDLSAWLAALKGGMPMFGSKGGPDRYVPMDFVDRWKTKTDADGRFRFHGLGHDRTATIRVSGAGIAVADLRVVTRAMESIKVNTTSPAVSSFESESTIYYGSHFQYAAEPSQVIEGVVRDSKTGEPLAGVGVSSSRFAGKSVVNDYKIQTVSDEHGAYRLEGMPKGEGNWVMAVPTDDQPYFTRELEVPTAPGLTPVKFDLNLHHGVMIQGRVTNRVTGAAVEGAWMHFIPWPDNPNLKGMTEYGGGSMHGSQTRYQTDHVGRFRVVGLPGRGLVEISHVTGPFPSGQGFGDIKGLPDAQQFLMVAGALFPSADTTPAVRETQIRDADAQVQVDFELEPGKQLTLNLVDPNGKSLAGVEAHGQWPKRQSFSQDDIGPSVDVVGLQPDEKRLVLLHQKDKNLGKAIRVCWKDTGSAPITVKLEPCGTLQARLLDKNGDPVRGGSIRFDAERGNFGLELTGGSTDSDGRLNYTTLLPGGDYTVYCECAQTGFQTLIKNLTVSPGEIVDLGEFDVTSKDRPKAKRTNAISSEIEPKTPAPADGKGEMKSPAAAGHDESSQSDHQAEDDLLSVSGRVLDPAGKPAAGAKVAAVQDYFTAWSHTSVPLVTTESDKAGRFHLEFRKSEIVQSDQLLQRVSIIAKPLDSKFGIAWIRCDAIKPGEETTLQLVADEPVEGSIVDLEGRPIAGVEVRVNELSTNAKGDLTAWLGAQKGDTSSLGSQDVDVPDRAITTEFANEWKTKTDADGRFRLTGLGRDRVVDILVSGHGTAAALRVVTRLMEPITVDATRRSVVPQLNIYYGSHFQYAVEPSQPIVGVVRDAKTGRPLAGVQVVSDRLAGRFSGILSLTTRDTVSDATGNYRLEGLPKGEGNEIVAMPPDGEPYFMRKFDVPTAPGFEPITLDLEMHRGVLIQGRVSDKATGAPIAGARMVFVPWPDNPNVNDVADLTRGHWREDVGGRYETDRDGRYTLVGVPGRGLVEVARVRLPRVYPPGQGLREIADLPSPREFFRVAGSQDPPDPKRIPAAKEIHIGQQEVQVQADIELESGKQLSLSVVDPEGKPLADVKVNGDLPREYAWRQITAGTRIDVMALWPEEERRIVLYQKERNLGKVIRVCWNNDRPGPVIVKLEPCATLKARLFDKYGDPVQGGSLRFAEVGRMDSLLAMPRGATDRDGRLNYTALVPGARYTVYCDAGQNLLRSIAEDLTVSPGEIIDLGEFDVTSKDRPKPVRTIAVGSRIQSKTTAPADGKDEMKSPAAAREMRKQP